MKHKYLTMCTLAASVSWGVGAWAQPQDAGQPRAGQPLTAEQVQEFQIRQLAQRKEKQEAAEAAERRTPAGMLQQFANALNTGDIALATRLVVGARPGRAQFLGTGRNPGSFVLIPLAADAPEGKDEFEARVVVDFIRRDPLELTDEPLLNAKMCFIEAVTLRRGGDGEWKVVPRPAPPALPTITKEAGPQLAAFEASIKAAQSESDGFLNTWARALSQPQVLSQKVASRISMSNVKQIMLGMLMLAQDFDEKYAFTPTDFQEKLQPYVKSRQLFLAPSLDEAEPFAYTLNPNIAGKSLAAFAEPARTVAVYEADKDGKLLARFEGRAVIGFVDGHVKMTTPEEAEKLIWKP